MKWAAVPQRIFRNVAQFGSAYRLGRWGHEFESLHSENNTMSKQHYGGGYSWYFGILAK